MKIQNLLNIEIWMGVVWDIANLHRNTMLLHPSNLCNIFGFSITKAKRKQAHKILNEAHYQAIDNGQR